MKQLTPIILSFAVLMISAGCQTIPIAGTGTVTLADGGTYVGSFKNAKFDTYGDFRLTGTLIFGPKSEFAGDKYVGEWRDGKRHGQGTYTYAKSGDKYAGEWRDGKQHGQGTITFAKSGNKHVSEWRDGKQHGQVTFTFAKSGNNYVGEWRDGKQYGQGSITYADGRIREGIWEKGKFKYAQKVSPKVIAKEVPTQKSGPKISDKKTDKKKGPTPRTKSGTSGSGFFVSKLGHVLTNEHVVRKCKSLTLGDNAKTQVRAVVVETDRRNDLALLRISSTEMASAETKSLIRKLGIKVVPLSSSGLLRSEDVELGEGLLVAGYPYGEIFSNTIKVTKGIVSAIRGIGDDSGQFQLDAAVQPGNSGGPIYDENGNIVGVVVAQLNKLKVAKTIGSLPENVNFGIKASTVRQFLTSSGLPTKWSERTRSMSSRDLAKIAKNQTLMVVCHR